MFVCHTCHGWDVIVMEKKVIGVCEGSFLMVNMDRCKDITGGPFEHVTLALVMARASSIHMVSNREKEKKCLRVQLKMMTCDLSALKNGTKIRKSPLGAMTESEPANQKRE